MADETKLPKGAAEWKPMTEMELTELSTVTPELIEEIAAEWREGETLPGILDASEDDGTLRDPDEEPDEDIPFEDDE